MDEGLLSIRATVCDQIVKMLITFEPHGIFGSKCAYLFNIVQPLVVIGRHPGEEASQSIILAR